MHRGIIDTDLRRRAWSAMGLLALFVVAYLGLTGWFAVTGARLVTSAFHGGRSAGESFFAGVCELLFALFMAKGLFFRRTVARQGCLEITPAGQPRLFAFLWQVADDAGAPRPHRVFLSAAVNASVSYDLSVLNLLFPTRKNLEIGLGLVNVLSVTQLRAVLAHEFGHFGQRTMLVGRWVAVAQQVTAQVIARRDWLDRFLDGLSRTDLRLAWIGWALRTVIWAIRSLLDSAFRVVLLAHRSLSREMEFQADAVAVSLTGSDALIEALHKLRGADEAWDEAARVADQLLTRGHRVPDLLALQDRALERLRVVLARPTFGVTPPRPQGDGARVRVFDRQSELPPHMWASHPSDADREERAKRVYRPSPLDETSPWSLFTAPEELRRQVTLRLLSEKAQRLPEVSAAEALAAVDAEYAQPRFDARHRGLHLAHATTRGAAAPAELTQGGAVDLPGALGALYPESLAGDVRRLGDLRRERQVLEAFRSGRLEVEGGLLRHRGRALRRRQAPTALAELAQDEQALAARLDAHDRQCRSTYQAAAKRAGPAWAAWHERAVDLLHLAEHLIAELRDRQAVLAQRISVETATGPTSGDGVSRILVDCHGLYGAMVTAWGLAAKVDPGAAVQRRAGEQTLTERLGTLGLNAPHQQNLNDWVNKVDGWLGQALAAWGGLAAATLNELLVGEAALERFVLAGAALPEVPGAPVVPRERPVLVHGQERPRPHELSWWARFQLADGPVASVARVVAACGILGSVVVLGATVGSATVVVHNGLGRPVVARLDDRAVTLGPGDQERVAVRPGATLHVATTTVAGLPIEAFDASLSPAGTTYLYNVAAADAVQEWTVTYGPYEAPPERHLGAPRFLETNADHVLEEPPRSINTREKGGTRRVVGVLDTWPPWALKEEVPAATEWAAMASAHARWDPPQSRWLLAWLEQLREPAARRQVAQARLDEDALDVTAHRVLQELLEDSEREAYGAQLRALVAGHPGDGDVRYLLARFEAGKADLGPEVVALSQQYPASGWLARAAAHELASHGRYGEAKAAAERALSKVPCLGEEQAALLARLRRVLARSPAVDLRDLAQRSEVVARGVASEAEGAALEQGASSTGAQAWALLSQGRLVAAARAAQALPAPARAGVLRLIAASEGATEGDLAALDHLAPEEGLSIPLALSGLGLAHWRGLPEAPLRAWLAGQGLDAGSAPLRFFDALVARRPTAEVEATLTGAPLEVRGLAVAMGVVALGPAAPEDWRLQARTILFGYERPFLAKP